MLIFATSLLSIPQSGKISSAGSYNILRIHVARSRHIILAERSAVRLALWNLHQALLHPRHGSGRLQRPEHSHASSTTTRCLCLGRCTKSCVRPHRPCANDEQTLWPMQRTLHARYALRTW